MTLRSASSTAISLLDNGRRRLETLYVPFRRSSGCGVLSFTHDCPIFSLFQDLASILDEESRFPVVLDDQLAYAGGGDGSMILDHDLCFLQGDLNYRIDLRRENVISSLRAGERAYLLEHDQLLKEMRTNSSFRLRTFNEAPIAFE